MSKTVKFEKAKEFVKGALIGTMAVPALGVLAHLSHYASDEHLSGYSLSNRFETAYNINVDPAKTYYASTPVISGYAQDTVDEPYWAHPYATYPAHVLLGLLGGIAAVSKQKQR